MPQIRIEGRQRALRHQADGFASQSAHAVLLEPEQIFPTKQDMPSRAPAFQAKQAQDRQCNGALAFAAPSHQAQHLAFGEF
jgi:hypothetical protein